MSSIPAAVGKHLMRTRAPRAVSSSGKTPVRMERSARVLRALGISKVSVEHDAGRRLRIVFEGGRLLSLNDLFAMHHRERHAYKMAQQQILEGVLLEHLGAPGRRVQVKPPCILRLERGVPIEGEWMDEDALSAAFKYLIDGLRKGRLIADDRRSIIPRIEPSQSLGGYRLAIEIESIP